MTGVSLRKKGLGRLIREGQPVSNCRTQLTADSAAGGRPGRRPSGGDRDGVAGGRVPRRLARGQGPAARAGKRADPGAEALNTERRRLPMVKITKTYVFSGPEGPVRLADLFGDQSQLIIQHVMFDPAGTQRARAAPPASMRSPTGSWTRSAPGTPPSPSSPGLRWPSSRPTGRPGAGRCPGTPRAAPTSTMTSRSLWTGRPGRCGTTTATSRQPQGRGVGGGIRSQLLPARRRGDLPHLFGLRPGHGVPRLGLRAARPDRVRQIRDWEEPKGRARVLHGADPTFTD